MVETLHFLNGCLIAPAALAVAILLLLQHRRGRAIGPASYAAILLVSLQICAQIYMGVSLLSDRGQRSMLHYSLGLLPVLLLLTVFWALPQAKARTGLITGIAFVSVAVIAILAIFIG